MNKPRNLAASVKANSYQVASHEGLARTAIRNALQEPDNPHQYGLLNVPSHLARGQLQRYARGDPLDMLRAYFHDEYVRHARDGWRRTVSDPGAGLPESARPQPGKTFVLSKAEAYARWIELVCGEQATLIDLARKALGKRKTMPSLDALLEALAGVGLGIHARSMAVNAYRAGSSRACARLPASSFV